MEVFNGENQVELSNWIEHLPVASSLLQHQDDYGQIKSCCHMAALQLETLAKAADARNGVAGVLKSAQTFLKWGPRRAVFLCDALKWHSELDCGAMSALARHLLSHSQSVITGQITPISVSFVAMCTQDERDIWRQTFEKENRSCGNWIFDQMYYHECVGLVSADGELSVWNYDHWMISGINGNVARDGGILWWRLDTDRDVKFGGVLIPGMKGQWIGLGDKNFEVQISPGIASDTMGIFGGPVDSLMQPQEPKSAQEFIRNRHQSINSDYGQKSINNLMDSSTESTNIPTVFVSGTSVNGDNPSPGVGVARSLRRAFGKRIRLIGVDNSVDSAGLHDPVFDDITILSSPLREDARDHFHSVLHLLHSSPFSLYLSCLDVEVRLLSEIIAENEGFQEDLVRRILVPKNTAIEAITKPEIPISEQMPHFRVAPFIEQQNNESDTDFLERAKPFMHSCSFPIFVKSRHYDAISVNNFQEAKSAVNRLHSIWESPVFMQESSMGFEESIMFCAFEGHLLPGTVHMRKTMTTNLGKTWAAKVDTDLPHGFLGELGRAVERMGWTGGAEIEYVRTLDGWKFVFDWNPRFPAWVDGASLQLSNLPAKLIHWALQEIFELRLEIEEPKGEGPKGFVRTIEEIPWSDRIQPLILRGPEYFASCVLTGSVEKGASSKEANTRCMQHPSRNTTMASLLQKYMKEKSRDLREKIDIGMTQNKIQGQADSTRGQLLKTAGRKEALKIHKEKMKALPTTNELAKVQSTPYRHLNTSFLNQSMKIFKKSVKSAVMVGSHGKIEPLVAVSIKTQPDIRILREALKCGLVAEAISMAEYDLARMANFESGKIIINGPAKFWSRGRDHGEIDDGFLATFADSVSEFEELCGQAEKSIVSTKSSTKNEQTKIKGILGVRLAIPGTGTRFGLDISDPETLQRLLECLNHFPDEYELGFHFHYASSELGLRTWFGLCRTFVAACRAITASSSRCPKATLLDFGGGFSPVTGRMVPQLERGLRDLMAMVNLEMPDVRRVVLEPGKAIVQKSATLITRVLAIREPVLRQSQLGKSMKIQKENGAWNQDFTNSETCITNEKETQIPTRAVIVDACLADMPLIHAHHHSLYALNSDTKEWIPCDEGGNDVVLGRICMENDVLASGIRLPSDLKVGDMFALSDAGAYDSSMAYPFGEGSQQRNKFSSG